MMKVFICWSGDRSMRIAAFLRSWLPTVHQNIDPFMSADDIGKGIRWISQLSSELATADFGIVCLTPENLSAPWLHFEAGALSKLQRSHVVPLLFQLTPADVHGPLSDFQSTRLGDKKEMLGLLTSVNDAMGKEAGDNWRRTFEELWDQVRKLVEDIIAENRIHITSPTDGGMLEDQRKHPNPDVNGYTYRVRGTLKYLPKPHSIWLLNASEDGRQWPQEVAKHDPVSATWEGRIYLSTSQKGTFINAAVAPPTSQEFFEYYHACGNAKPLSRIPEECNNFAQVLARVPDSQ
jgi:hypothetical protein